jgi:hypothetical protein
MVERNGKRSQSLTQRGRRHSMVARLHFRGIHRKDSHHDPPDRPHFSVGVGPGNAYLFCTSDIFVCRRCLEFAARGMARADLVTVCVGNADWSRGAFNVRQSSFFRPIAGRMMSVALCVLAAWTALSYSTLALGNQNTRSSDWWQILVLIAILPGVGTLHLMILAAEARRSGPAT